MTELNKEDPFAFAFNENENSQTQMTSTKNSVKKRKKSKKTQNNNEKKTLESEVNEFLDENENKKRKGLLSTDEDDVSQMGSDDTTIDMFNNDKDNNSVIQKNFDKEEENEENFEDTRSNMFTPVLPEIAGNEKVEDYLSQHVNVKVEMVDLVERSVEKPSVIMNEDTYTLKKSTYPTYFPDNSRVTYYMRFRDQIAQQQRLTDYSLIHRGKHPVLVNWHEQKLKYDKFLQNIPNASLRAALIKETAESMLNLPVELKIPKQSLPTATAGSTLNADEEAAKIAAEKKAAEEKALLALQNRNT